MKTGLGTRDSGLGNRIDATFARLRNDGRTALVPFITAGDPFPDATVDVMHALVDAGADLIELGVPFSDPMADGPVIQHANERALRNHVGIANILGWVREFRERDLETPVVLMGYLNPIEQYRSAGQPHPWADRHQPLADVVFGIERFAGEAVDAGVDGVLIVDCPVEEDATLQPLRTAGLKRILLAAPTTSDARLAHAIETAEGYLYYVSFAGITGAAKLAAADIASRVGDLRERAKVPIAVGFGIKDAVSAKAVAVFADAVVIGSALVGTLAGAASTAEACRRATAFLAPIRAALDGR